MEHNRRSYVIIKKIENFPNTKFFLQDSPVRGHIEISQSGPRVKNNCPLPTPSPRGTNRAITPNGTQYCTN